MSLISIPTANIAKKKGTKASGVSKKAIDDSAKEYIKARKHISLTDVYQKMNNSTLFRGLSDYSQGGKKQK